MTRFWYHATPASNLPLIRTRGLGGRTGRGSSGLRASKRRGKTYLFQDFGDAVDFAEQVSGEVKGSTRDWAILKVEIPPSVRVSPDSEFGLEIGEGGPGYFTSTIPPKYIRVVRLVSTSEALDRKSSLLEEYGYVSTPFWAIGSRGGKWIPIWELDLEDLDLQVRALEGSKRRFTSAMFKESDQKQLDFYRRVQREGVSKTEKADLVEDTPRLRITKEIKDG